MEKKINLDDLISRTYRFDEINEGFALMLAGEVARGVIVFERQRPWREAMWRYRAQSRADLARGARALTVDWTGARYFFYKRRSQGAQVAQLVEQRTENPCVGGSIPPLGTIAFPARQFSVV